jgi:hypothetical protein
VTHLTNRDFWGPRAGMVITPEVVKEAQDVLVYRIRACASYKRHATAAYYGHLSRWDAHVGDLMADYYGEDWPLRYPADFRLFGNVLRESITAVPAIPAVTAKDKRAFEGGNLASFGYAMGVQIEETAPAFFQKTIKDFFYRYMLEQTTYSFNPDGLINASLRLLNMYNPLPSQGSDPLLSSVERCFCSHLDWLVGRHRGHGETLMGIIGRRAETEQARPIAPEWSP